MLLYVIQVFPIFFQQEHIEPAKQAQCACFQLLPIQLLAFWNCIWPFFSLVPRSATLLVASDEKLGGAWEQGQGLGM